MDRNVTEIREVGPSLIFDQRRAAPRWLTSILAFLAAVTVISMCVFALVAPDGNGQPSASGTTEGTVLRITFTTADRDTLVNIILVDDLTHSYQIEGGYWLDPEVIQTTVGDRITIRWEDSQYTPGVREIKCFDNHLLQLQRPKLCHGS